MNLVVSEVEFAVLTVLISVGVNDSAPSLGTHYRGWLGEERGRKMESVSRKNDRNAARSVISSFLSFG